MKKNYNEMVNNIRINIKRYIIKSNLKSLVIGVSGGIDSALVCALVKPVCDELNIPLIGRSISIHSNKLEEEERARSIGKEFCTDFNEINLTKQYLILKEIDDLEGISENDTLFKIRMGNIKARMRMIYLYNLAARTNGIVLGTENKTEYNLAFFTLHGDAGTDLEPIEGLWKTEVYNISEYIANNGTDKEKSALMACINCDATDGLGISNTDLDQILPDWETRHDNSRSGYKEVDNIFIEYFKALDEKDKEKLNNIEKSPVIQRHIRTNFKRNHPYIIGREDI